MQGETEPFVNDIYEAFYSVCRAVRWKSSVLAPWARDGTCGDVKQITF